MRTKKPNVTVVDEHGKKLFILYMENIPRKGDKIGFWIDREWTIVDVDYTVFELAHNNIGTFWKAEVNVILNQ